MTNTHKNNNNSVAGAIFPLFVLVALVATGGVVTAQSTGDDMLRTESRRRFTCRNVSMCVGSRRAVSADVRERSIVYRLSALESSLTAETVLLHSFVRVLWLRCRHGCSGGRVIATSYLVFAVMAVVALAYVAVVSLQAMMVRAWLVLCFSSFRAATCELAVAHVPAMALQWVRTGSCLLLSRIVIGGRAFRCLGRCLRLRGGLS
jgi:hypothetical protein